MNKMLASENEEQKNVITEILKSCKTCLNKKKIYPLAKTEEIFRKILCMTV